MRPLTLELPKPLISVAGRPVLEHIIDALPSEIDEIILIVGYKAEMLEQHFGDSYKGRTMRYVHQEVPEGTARALWLAQPLLNEGRFLFAYADDLHGARAIKEALSYPRAILAATSDEPWKFGVIELTSDHTLARIVEKPEVPPSNLISAGVMVLDTHIFKYETVRDKSGEYYVTHPLGLYAQEYPMQVVEQEVWIPIGYPEDIAIAEERLSSVSDVLQEA